MRVLVPLTEWLIEIRVLISQHQIIGVWNYRVVTITVSLLKGWMWLEHLADCIIGSWIVAESPCALTLLAGLNLFTFMFLLVHPHCCSCLAGDTTGLALHVVSSSRTLLCIFFSCFQFLPSLVSLLKPGHQSLFSSHVLFFFFFKVVQFYWSYSSCTDGTRNYFF